MRAARLVEHDGLGIAAERGLGLLYLAKGRRVFDQHAAMVGLAVPDPGEVRLQLLSHAFFAALTLVPLVDENEIAPVAED